MARGGPKFGLRLPGFHRWLVTGTTFANFPACGYIKGSEVCASAVLGFPVPCGLVGSGGFTTKFEKT